MSQQGSICKASMKRYATLSTSLHLLSYVAFESPTDAVICTGPMSLYVAINS